MMMISVLILVLLELTLLHSLDRIVVILYYYVLILVLLELTLLPNPNCADCIIAAMF